MSHVGHNRGPDPANDQQLDELPLKVTHARLGSVVGTSSLVGELTSERLAPPSLGGAGQFGSSFQVVSSPFKTLSSSSGKAFSSIPEHASKQIDINMHLSLGLGDQTPSKIDTNNPYNVDTPDRFDLFQGGNHAMSQVRHVATNLGRGDLVSPLSNPLIDSMLGAVLGGSPQSPLTNYYNGSLHSRPSFQPELAPEIPHRVVPVRPEASSAAPTESQSDISADLDIRSIARGMDATMFQGSLANNRNFSMSKPQQTQISNSEAPYHHHAQAGADTYANPAVSKNLFDTSLLAGVDNISSNLFGDLSIEEEPRAWQGSDSFQRDLLDRSTSMNSCAGSHYGFASRSFPQFPHQAAQICKLSDDSLFSLQDPGLSNNITSHSSNNSVNNNNSRSILSTGNELMHSDYPVKHSYPPYHRYGNQHQHMSTYQQNEPHQQLHSQPHFAPKRQNWMDEGTVNSGPAGNQYFSGPNRNNDVSNVDEYTQLSSQLSDDFVMYRGNQNSGKTYGNSNVPNPAYANHPNARYGNQSQPRGPLGHPHSAPYNPSAPTYPPRYETMSQQAGGQSSWNHPNAHYSQSDASRSSHSYSDSTTGYNRSSDYDVHGEPVLAGPHQQQQYEPPLPTTNNVRVGKHRGGARSEGSINLDMRLSSDTTTGTDMRNSGNLLISSVDSDLSTVSGGKHRREASDKVVVPPKPTSTKEVFKNTFIRPELIESQETKAAFQKFCREFRQKEKEGYEAAKVHALKAVDVAPDNGKWRIYLEMADLSKRNNHMDEARYYFSRVCDIQPIAHMGWYEWSKLEEESGDLKEALEILKRGLKACTINETLLTKVIKLHERLHRYDEVREMLGQLKHEPTEKMWRSMLEGSLFEARTGNIPISRKLFKFLISHVPWYGPIYFEAFRLEEKEDCDSAAYDIIVRGLKELPRYGPLWFGLFRIMERQDTKVEFRNWQNGSKPVLHHLSGRASEAVRQISKELTWKVHFEMSQAQERAAEVAAIGLHQHTGRPLLECRDEMLSDARKSLVRSLLSCPANLRWRVLLVGARLELGVGAIDKARMLLHRATMEVPVKSKSYVYLECSRVEEYIGNLDAARQLLVWAKQEVNREWKVFLEAVLVEARAGLIEKAASVARDAVKHHPGTGRLWAIYIQLCHRLEMKHFYETEQPLIQQRLDHLLGIHSFNSASPAKLKDIAAASPNLWLSKERVIRRAITEVPKSGEVWCERARCQLNPLSVHCFDLNQAQRSLCFAIQFTPQYGDTFVEYVRLEMLVQVLLPRVLEVLGLPVLPFWKTHLYEDPESDTVEIMLDQRRAAQVSTAAPASWPANEDDRAERVKRIVALEKMCFEFGNLSKNYAEILFKNLNRRSVNADPNYGSAWFHCREQPYDIPSYVLHNAVHKLVHELADTQALYGRALFHFIRRTLLQSSTTAASSDAGAEQQLARNRSFVQEDSSPACSPTRSSSAPPGRNRDAKAAPVNSTANHATTQSANSGGTGSGKAPSTAAPDFTKSLEGKLKARAQDHSAVSYGLTMMGGRRSPSRDDNTLDTSTHAIQHQEIELEDITVGRVKELMEDIDAAEALLGAWPSLNQVEMLPFVATGSGAVYCSTDFITGLVEMNRTMFNPNLPEETRRKNLFGSDQIVS